MNFYIDIIINPDAEMPLNRLLNTLYAKLHKTLFDLQSKNIGVSFPAYKVLLGNCLRIHGSQDSLINLQKSDWIGGLIGYCKVSEILLVPSTCQYKSIGRIQTTMSPAKLRRLIKRGTIAEDEVKQYKAKMFTKGLDNPYVELESASNGHKHRRYIQFGDLLDRPVEGEFDTFGLSKTATIPWF